MKVCVAMLIFVFSFSYPLYAMDMRKASVIARQELKQAMAREQARKAHINKSKTELTEEISRLEAENMTLASDIDVAEKRIALLQESNSELLENASDNASSMEELAPGPSVWPAAT